MKRLAIITTHPIQYNAPLFKLLAERKNISIKVFYTWGSSVLENKFDPGFGKTINWDIPLLEGYEYCFVKNTSTHPGTHHFKGIINPLLIKEIEDWRADLILVYGWSFKSHLQCLRYFHKKIPLFFRGDSTLLDEESGIKKILRTVFLKWVYRNVDHVLYVGTQNKLYYLRHGLKENQLVFAPHAIDNNRFYDADNLFENAAQDWKQKLNIPSNSVVFLFAGKFENKKDPFLLVHAFSKIENKDARLILAGNGLLQSQLKQKAGADKRIIFLDFQNQSLMPVVYRLCDVFILPSKGPGETWGLCINEAMACGKAVIVSDKVGCAVDLVEDNANGYIFCAGDVDDLADKMNSFIIDKTKPKKMGDQSFKKIQQWNFTTVAESIEKLVLTC